MIWIRDKELSVLIRVAVFLKKHIFCFRAHSYDPKTFQCRLAFQPLLHTHRQFSLIAGQSHRENGTWAFWKHVTSTKGDSGSFAANFSAEAKSPSPREKTPSLLRLAGPLLTVSTTTCFSCLCNSTCSVECKHKSGISSEQFFSSVSLSS